MDKDIKGKFVQLNAEYSSALGKGVNQDKAHACIELMRSLRQGRLSLVCNKKEQDVVDKRKAVAKEEKSRTTRIAVQKKKNEDRARREKEQAARQKEAKENQERRKEARRAWEYNNVKYRLGANRMSLRPRERGQEKRPLRRERTSKSVSRFGDALRKGGTSRRGSRRGDTTRKEEPSKKAEGARSPKQEAPVERTPTSKKKSSIVMERGNGPKKGEALTPAIVATERRAREKEVVKTVEVEKELNTAVEEDEFTVRKLTAGMKDATIKEVDRERLTRDGFLQLFEESEVE